MRLFADGGEVDALLALTGTAAHHVTTGADIGETGGLQPPGQLLHGIGTLAVDLQLTIPRAVALLAEQIYVVGAQTAAVLGAPDAVGVLRLVQKHLTVSAASFSTVLISNTSRPPGAMNRCSR